MRDGWQASDSVSRFIHHLTGVTDVAMPLGMCLCTVFLHILSGKDHVHTNDVCVKVVKVTVQWIGLCPCSQKLNRCDRFMTPALLASSSASDLTELKYLDVVAIRDRTKDGSTCVEYGSIQKCRVRPGLRLDNDFSEVDEYKGKPLGADRVALSDKKAFVVVTWFQRLMAKTGGNAIKAKLTKKLAKAVGGDAAKKTQLSVFKRLDVNLGGRIGDISEVRVIDIISKVRMHRCQVPGHESNGPNGKGELYVLSAVDEGKVQAKHEQEEKSKKGKARQAGAYGSG